LPETFRSYAPSFRHFSLEHPVLYGGHIDVCPWPLTKRVTFT